MLALFLLFSVMWELMLCRWGMLSCKYWGLKLVVEAWLASKYVDGLVQWKKWFVIRPMLKSIAPGTDNLLCTSDANLLSERWWLQIASGSSLECVCRKVNQIIRGVDVNRRRRWCALCCRPRHESLKTYSLSLLQTKTGRISIIWEQEIELDWPNRLFWEVHACTYIGLLERNGESRG